MLKTSPVEPVRWTEWNGPGWRLYAAATETGLCCVELQGTSQRESQEESQKESFEEFTSWIRSHIPSAVLEEDTEKMQPYVSQLAEYFEGRRQTFTMPLDMRGTDFQKEVWTALSGIPFGTTRSYSEVAALVGRPKAVRAVGAANGANPLPVVIPCHRVIGKSGDLTGYRGGLDIKVALLRLEGVGV